MKNVFKTLTILLFGCFLVAGNAAATPLNANSMALPELQGVFSSIGSSIDANIGDSQDEVFAFQTTGATATYVATVSYGASDIEFGLYDLYDAANTVTLFDTASPIFSTPGDATHINITYNSSDNSVVAWKGTDPFNIEWSDSATFSTERFGFYTTSVYDTYYSESELNATGSADLDGDGLNDNDHFLTYAGQGDAVTIGAQPPLNDIGHWYIASEVTPINNSGDDFSDIVVQVQSMQPVPEPATMLLFGLGLIGIAGFGRKKYIKK